MFNIHMPFYGTMFVLSLVANVIIVIWFSKNYSFKRNEIICLLFYENVGIIVGAKILTFFLKYKELNGKFNFSNLGLNSTGAIIGAILFILLFGFQFKKSFKELAYLFTPSVPLMYAIGKIGCFLVGCCYGIKYSGFGSIIYRYSSIAPNNIHLFPVQLVETISFILIFLYMIIKQKKKDFNFRTIGNSIILCGLIKFSLDFLRASHANTILSFNQIMSMIFIFIGIIILIINKHIKK